MTVNNSPNAEARRAALEAARKKAAEEAARKAAAEAARKKAAEEAARMAASPQAQAVARDADGTARPGESSKLSLPGGVNENSPQALKERLKTLSPDELKKDPALAAKLGDLATKGSPEEKQAVADAAKRWVKEAMAKGAAEGRDPQAVIDKDLPELAKATGLGAAIQGAVRPGVEAAAAELLNKGVKPEDLAKPAIGKLLSVVQDGSDQGLKDKLKDAVKAYAEGSLKKNLEGKEKEEGVKKAMEGYQKDLQKLAETTGLGTSVQAVAEKVVKSKEGDLKATAEKGKHWWEKIGDFVSGIFSKVGDFLKKGFDFVGKGLNFAVQGIGKVASAPAKLVSAGLDAVGLDGAAKVVGKVGEGIDKGAQWVGKQAEGFTQGVGAALKGTVEGVGQIIGHPIETAKAIGGLIAHPSRIKDVAKAFWAEATKGGVAHAFGYIAGNLAPMLLTGGAATGANGAKISLLAKGGEALQGTRFAAAGTKLSLVADKGGRAMNVARGIKGFDPKRIIESFDQPATLANGTQVTREVTRYARQNGKYVRDAEGKLVKETVRVPVTKGDLALERLPKPLREGLKQISDQNIGGWVREVFTKGTGREFLEAQVLGYGKLINRIKPLQKAEKAFLAATQKGLGSDFALEMGRQGINTVNMIAEADKARVKREQEQQAKVKQDQSKLRLPQ